jgi:hypothetical protein
MLLQTLIVFSTFIQSIFRRFLKTQIQIFRMKKNTKLSRNLKTIRRLMKFMIKSKRYKTTMPIKIKVNHRSMKVSI